MGNEKKSFDKWMVGLENNDSFKFHFCDQRVIVIQCVALIKVLIANFAKHEILYL